MFSLDTAPLSSVRVGRRRSSCSVCGTDLAALIRSMLPRTRPAEGAVSCLAVRVVSRGRIEATRRARHRSIRNRQTRHRYSASATSRMTRILPRPSWIGLGLRNPNATTSPANRVGGVRAYRDATTCDPQWRRNGTALRVRKRRVPDTPSGESAMQAGKRTCSCIFACPDRCPLFVAHAATSSERGTHRRLPVCPFASRSWVASAMRTAAGSDSGLRAAKRIALVIGRRRPPIFSQKRWGWPDVSRETSRHAQVCGRERLSAEGVGESSQNEEPSRSSRSGVNEVVSGRLTPDQTLR